MLETREGELSELSQQPAGVVELVPKVMSVSAASFRGSLVGSLVLGSTCFCLLLVKVPDLGRRPTHNCPFCFPTWVVSCMARFLGTRMGVGSPKVCTLRAVVLWERLN